MCYKSNIIVKTLFCTRPTWWRKVKYMQSMPNYRSSNRVSRVISTCSTAGAKPSSNLSRASQMICTQCCYPGWSNKYLLFFRSSRHISTSWWQRHTAARSMCWSVKHSMMIVLTFSPSVSQQTRRVTSFADQIFIKRPRLGHRQVLVYGVILLTGAHDWRHCMAQQRWCKL